MANNFPTIRPTINFQFDQDILPPDVTFTRASQSGGYYDGKTVSKAEENLLLRSQEFDNAAWLKSSVTVTANTTLAPDGTTTADTVTNTAAAISMIRQSVTTSASVHVMSIFLKQGTDRYIQIFDNISGANFAVFDLQDGAVTQSGANYTASIVAAANGFYRCIVAFTSSAASRDFRIAFTDNNATPGYSPTPANTGLTMIVWGAQLEQRSSVTAYTPTTTQPITNYIPKMLFAPANVPVFDHNPVTGEALGLSVWEARTNLLLRSQEFDNAYWTKSNATVTADQIIAPDGTLTADLLVPTVASAQHFVTRTLSITPGAAYTLSVYAKSSNNRWMSLQPCTGNNAWFDLQAGVLGTVQGGLTATINSVGNGWYRCTVTIASAIGNDHYIFARPSNGGTTYTGDGVSGIYIWGAQLEAGAFATPYIPTVASTVARSADVAVMTGVNFSRWFNAGEGSFVVDANSVAGGAFRSTLRATDSAASNLIELGMVTGTNNGQGRYQVNYAGAAQVDTGNVASPAFVANTFYKNAASYKVSDFAISRDGAAVVADTSGSVPLGLDRLELGGRHITSANLLNGYIKSLSYYPARLTNAQLQAITG
jgi:hypothetical protein